MVKNRRRCNIIIQIKNESDQWITEVGEIEHCFQKHFQNLYAQPQNEAQDIKDQLSSLPLPILSAFQATQLELPILDEEIILAINQLRPLKTPRPDRLPAAFYQKY